MQTEYSNTQMQELLDRNLAVLAFYEQDIGEVEEWVLDDALQVLESIFQIVCDTTLAKSLPDLIALKDSFIEQLNSFGLEGMEELDDFGKLTVLAACAVTAALYTEGDDVKPIVLGMTNDTDKGHKQPD